MQLRLGSGAQDARAFVDVRSKGLISALEKLKDDHTSTHFASKATAHLWIEEPLDKESNRGDTRWNHLFDTHPPIDDRIHALEQM